MPFMEGCQYLQGVQELIPHRYWRMTEGQSWDLNPSEPSPKPVLLLEAPWMAWYTWQLPSGKSPEGSSCLSPRALLASLNLSIPIRKWGKPKIFSGLVLHMQSHPFRNRSEEPFKVLSPPDVNIPPETSPGHGLIHLTLESFQVQVTLQLGKKPTLTPDT